MKALQKNIIYLSVTFLCLIGISLHSQITGLSYGLEFNEDSKLYDFYINVNAGTAESIIHRTQFNAQVSIVAPSNCQLKIAQNYMPLEDNQNYAGTIAAQWKISSIMESPEVCIGKSFYGITPRLVPSAQYNNLKEGDHIKLFSMYVNPLADRIDDVYIFRNDNDPDSKAIGMMGSDFSNGFTIGGLTDIYQGNLGTLIVSKSKGR